MRGTGVRSFCRQPSLSGLLVSVVSSSAGSPAKMEKIADSTPSAVALPNSSAHLPLKLHGFHCVCCRFLRSIAFPLLRSLLCL